MRVKGFILIFCLLFSLLIGALWPWRRWCLVNSVVVLTKQVCSKDNKRYITPPISRRCRHQRALYCVCHSAQHNFRSGRHTGNNVD